MKHHTAVPTILRLARYSNELRIPVSGQRSAGDGLGLVSRSVWEDGQWGGREFQSDLVRKVRNDWSSELDRMAVRIFRASNRTSQQDTQWRSSGPLWPPRDANRCAVKLFPNWDAVTS